MKKSRILISLLVMALSAALIGGATMAWFTDSAESAPVTMTAGTLLISINDFVLEGVEEGLSINNMNPGDVQAASFAVTNDGTKNLQFLGYLCWEDIIGQLNDDLVEEMKALLVDKGYGDGELSDVLNFKISVRGATWDYFNLGEGVFYNGALPETGPLEFGLAELAPGDSLTYDVEMTLPGEETGNAFQGSKINLAFGVVAGQTTNDAPAPTLDNIVCPFTPMEFVVVQNSGQNDINRGLNRPHINWTIDGREIDFDFVNPITGYTYVFDYRIDLEEGESHDWSDTIINPGGELAGELIGDRYNWVGVAPNTTQSRTLTADNEIWVGLRVGAENDWYLNWIKFELRPVVE